MPPILHPKLLSKLNHHNTASKGYSCVDREKDKEARIHRVGEVKVDLSKEDNHRQTHLDN